MNYTPYPKEKDTPSRKSRKSSRSTTFIKNAGLAALKRREKKAARRAAEEALENEENA